MKTISTYELVQHVVRKSYEPDQDGVDLVEASLLLNGNVRATHFLYYDNPYIYDEGIDGIQRSVSPAKFITDYHKGCWIIRTESN